MAFIQTAVVLKIFLLLDDDELLDEDETPKLVTILDMDAGLSVLVLVATEEVEDQADMLAALA